MPKIILRKQIIIELKKLEKKSARKKVLLEKKPCSFEKRNVSKLNFYNFFLLSNEKFGQRGGR